MLDLDFSSEQTMLKETVRDILAAQCPLSEVRRLEDDPIGYSTELWATLGELDLIGLTLPEEYGGSGMTMIEGAALYEEIGRALAPLPHLVSAVMAGGAIAMAGSDAMKAEILPSVASGASILSVAWLEPENSFGPKGVEMKAETTSSGFSLTGTKRHVAFAKAAERLVVLARTGVAPTDVDLFLVRTDAPGVSMTQQKTIASDCQYQVEFNGVEVSEADRIGDAGSGWSTWERVVRESWILSAAQAVGGAQYAAEITVQYAKDRQQFDKPLGAFQSLAHYMADDATNVDGAEQIVHEAAWASAAGRPITSLAPMAKLFACRTFRDLTANSQQIFGGIGFTVEYDIQLYFRRAKALQLSWGDDRTLTDAIAAALLD
jgi:hypothetical protein